MLYNPTFLLQGHCQSTRNSQAFASAAWKVVAVKALEGNSCQCGTGAGGQKHSPLIPTSERQCQSFPEILTEMQSWASAALWFCQCCILLLLSLSWLLISGATSQISLLHQSHFLRRFFLGRQIYLWMGEKNSWYHCFLSPSTPQSFSRVVAIIPSNLIMWIVLNKTPKVLMGQLEARKIIALFQSYSFLSSKKWRSQLLQSIPLTPRPPHTHLFKHTFSLLFW